MLPGFEGISCQERLEKTWIVFTGVTKVEGRPDRNI